MKRTEPLRADPAKTRAWQERSRAKAAQNARDRAESREGERSGSLRRGRGIAGAQVIPEGQARRSAATYAKKPAPVRFRAPRSARLELCPTCLLAGVQRSAASWHHWLPQQQIRVYVRGLRLDEDEARRRLRGLLADQRNLTAFCADHHGSHGSTAHDFVRAQVPDSAFAFALELGQEWAERLVRLYPVRRP